MSSFLFGLSILLRRLFLTHLNNINVGVYFVASVEKIIDPQGRVSMFVFTVCDVGISNKISSLDSGGDLEYVFFANTDRIKDVVLLPGITFCVTHPPYKQKRFKTVQ